MTTDETITRRKRTASGPTANTRLKASFGAWFWGSIALSAAVHFAVLSIRGFVPAAELVMREKAPPLEQIALASPVRLPPPPDLVLRPAVPVLAMDLLPVDITIPEFAFAELPKFAMPTAPIPQFDITEQPVFVPRDVEPILQNRREIQQFLERNYPGHLQRAGLGGTAVFEAFLDEEGSVVKTIRVSSSGFRVLDELAERVFSRMRFSPALYRYHPTPVWVRMPVRFVAP